MDADTRTEQYEAPGIEQRTDIGPSLIGGPLASVTALP